MTRHLRASFAGYARILKELDYLLIGFAQDKILTDGYLLKKWQPTKGRFRDYLRASLTMYVLDWWRKQPEYEEWEWRQKGPWKNYRFFAALDAASDGYDAIVVNHTDEIATLQFHFARCDEGWREFDRRIGAFRPCPIALASGCSAPPQLLKRDYDVYQAGRESAETPGLLPLVKAFRKDGYKWWSVRFLIGWGNDKEDEAASPVENLDIDSLDLMRAVLAITLEKLERECKENRPQPRGRQIWEVFRLKMLEPILSNAHEPSSRELAELVSTSAQATTPAQLDNMSFDAREMFRKLLHEVISEYEKTGQATKSELQPVRLFLERFTQKRRKKTKKKLVPNKRFANQEETIT